MSTRSTDRARPRTAAAGPRPAPAADNARAARYTEAIRDISEDITVLGETLLNSAYGVAAPASEMMNHLVALDRLVREATGVLVVRQRLQRKPLTDLADLLELTDDRLRKKYRPQDIDDAIGNRCRPQRTPPAEPAPGDPDGRTRLRGPRQRLACALTRMWRASGRRQYEIASRMGVDDSYVSRLLSGEREASWQHVLVICEVCGGDADLMKPLWEAAAGVRPADTDPTQRLRTYLRALHYAAGSPSTEKILASAQHTITATELELAFNGPGVPAWPTVAELFVALQGLPETARQLWRRARAVADETSD
ncbi:hypothetical protein CF54_39780 [Streptomyces sp. Tu 6176]|uniref:helix-turn-helix domain-containing protein n=1 Tax=Streptomyces sp. Tu 6176 TaxID=1470557 RepID=UPI000446D35C|nr:helix-turn-helix transcriptional regulator [Streptomyces sp. Tu 6176]EYT77965.1 hypothetical protein CF54_39780 [Streptomyces sp. Tu 6176]